MSDRTAANRRFVLARRPMGAFGHEDLELHTDAVPRPCEGQALVRVDWLSVDPSNRLWMGKGESYMPPVDIGSAMRGIAVGTVVESRCRRYRVGRRVLGLLGWQDWTVISPGDDSQAMSLPRLPGLSGPRMLGVLGINGLTAWFGVRDMARPRRGETLFVAAAAGATGSLVGQLALLRGARVVGMAGSREKCDWLTGTLGFTAAVDRSDPDWRVRLTEATPDGIDVDFEMVGGEVMRAVLDRLNQDARVALCGLVSELDQEGVGVGGAGFTQVLIRRATVRGFDVGDYRSRFPLAMARLALLIATGRLKERYHVVEGLERAPEALAGLLAGTFTGKVVVDLAAGGPARVIGP